MRRPASCPSPATPRLRETRSSAFTLVELLVVIGIIAVLISLLLPSLTGARKQAERVKCLAALQQTGQAFALYAANNQGAWPLQRLQWPKAGVPGGYRERRFYDFLSPYVLNGRETAPNGEISGNEGAPFISDPDIKDGNNVLWGCPTWKRRTLVGANFGDATIHTGYNMNIFPFAPDDLDATGNYFVNQRKVAQQNLDGGSSLANNTPPSALALLGKFWRSTLWKKPTERALMYDSVHPLTVVTFIRSNPDYVSKWPYKPENPSGLDFPVEPDGGIFALDYNRHGRKANGNPFDVPSMNMLFCDGHAAYVSAREAYQAIRMNRAATAP